MLCRKRINFHERCENEVYTDGTEGYCQEHWYRYQIGLDFHDPSNDFDYEDPFFEMLESIENETFFNISFLKQKIWKKKIKHKANLETQGLCTSLKLDLYRCFQALESNKRV